MDESLGRGDKFNRISNDESLSKFPTLLDIDTFTQRGILGCRVGLRRSRNVSFEELKGERREVGGGGEERRKKRNLVRPPQCPICR